MGLFLYFCQSKAFIAVRCEAFMKIIRIIN